MAIRNGQERTISANSGLGLLQMVLELDTERGANEDVGLLRKVDCEILHRLKRGTKHSL